MVFIWIDQGIREPYIPKIKHIPLRGTSETMPGHSGGKINIHEERNPRNPMHHVNPESAAESYQESGIKTNSIRDRVKYARDIMSQPVITLFDNNSVDDAQKLFKGKRFRHIPVVNRENNLVGIISDRDILKIEIEMGHGYRQTQLKEIMKHKVLTANNDADIRDIARVMLDEKIGSMVITGAGKVTGIITRTDILRAVVHHAPLELWI